MAPHLLQIPNLHREEYLAVQRGVRPPTPPQSTGAGSVSGKAAAETAPIDTSTSTSTRAPPVTEPLTPETPVLPPSPPRSPAGPVFVVRSVRDDAKELRYRGIRHLGTGTFSRVWLGVPDSKTPVRSFSTRTTTAPSRAAAPRTSELVALKIIELGPAGGADEQRVETSLRREIEVMKELNHPSIIHLKGVGTPADNPKQVVLALTHCAGGDLFDFARGRALPAALVRRIFTELVDATRYLHAHFIVHRDIKLENVLVNMAAPEIQAVPDVQTYPHPLVTLSDLGLSRHIERPPA
ncbi:hypothetical protein KEM52_003414, partial [Ascosphaera acerosa]